MDDNDWHKSLIFEYPEANLDIISAMPREAKILMGLGQVPLRKYGSDWLTYRLGPFTWSFRLHGF